jgi:pimeloyl-ACP methyl ester carboxylesterase
MKFNSPMIIAGVVCLLLAIWLTISLFVRIGGYSQVFLTQESKNLKYNFNHITTFIENSAKQKIEIVHNLDNDKPVVVYLHGNTGRQTKIMDEIVKNYNLVSPSYPGYSKSEGQPATDNVYETVDLTIDWVRTQGFKDDQIILLGHSLGGSPAVYGASKYADLKKVVLVNTFYNITRQCEQKYFIFCTMTGDVLPSNKYAKESKAKIRQFHVLNDEVIKYQDGKNLFNIINSSDKKFFDLEGSHNQFDINYVLNTD